MGERVQFSWADYSGGHIGERATWRFPANAWQGRNVVAYRDGTIGPRAGVIDAQITGVPAGQVKGMGFVPVPGKTLWFIVGNQVLCADIEAVGSTATVIGTLAVTPPMRVPFVRHGHKAIITVYGDKCYEIDTAAGTVTPLAGSPGGTCIVNRNGRLLVGTGNKIAYSEPNAFATWADPLNWFVVGSDQWQVRTINVVRDHLVISKQDGSLWALTGFSPAEWVLRQQIANGGPTWPHHVAVIEGALFFRAQYDLGNHAPFTYTSMNVEAIEHLQNTLVGEWHHIHPGTALAVASNETLGIVGLEFMGELVAVDGKNRRALLYRHGAWSLHFFDQLPELYGSLTADCGSGKVALTDGGAAGGSARFFLWRSLYLNRPVVSSDANARVGDASSTPLDAEFTLPEQFDEYGRDLKVRTIEIDLVSYATGAAVANQVQCTVTALRRTGQDDNTLPASTSTWTETTAPPAGTGGARRRLRFDLGDLPDCQAFTVRLHGLRGVRIEMVRVFADADGSRVAR
jgi:hypothetical protein